jgi:hypothetical protein
LYIPAVRLSSICITVQTTGHFGRLFAFVLSVWLGLNTSTACLPDLKHFYLRVSALEFGFEDEATVLGVNSG